MNKKYLTELISKAEHTTTQAIQKFMDDLLHISDAIKKTRKINRLALRETKKETVMIDETANTIIESELKGFYIGYFRYTYELENHIFAHDHLFAYNNFIESDEQIIGIEVENFSVKDIKNIVNGLNRILIKRADISVSTKDHCFNYRTIDLEQFIRDIKSSCRIVPGFEPFDEPIDCAQLGIRNGKNINDNSDKTEYLPFSFISYTSSINFQLTDLESYTIRQILNKYGAPSIEYHMYCSYLLNNYQDRLFASYLELCRADYIGILVNGPSSAFNNVMIIEKSIS